MIKAIEILKRIEESFLNCHYPLEHVMYNSEERVFGREYTVGEMFKKALKILKDNE